MTTETITYRQFDSAVKRAEKAELKRSGRSLSAVTIGAQHTLMRFGAKIVGCFPERRTMTLGGDWRSAVKLAAADWKPAPPSQPRQETDDERQERLYYEFSGPSND